MCAVKRVLLVIAAALFCIAACKSIDSWNPCICQDCTLKCTCFDDSGLGCRDDQQGNPCVNMPCPNMVAHDGGAHD